jgi:hypothetical protein
MDVSLPAHVERFNEGVRSGDFGPMLDAFATDAELVFEGVPVGPFDGIEAIAAAYAAQPPDDEVRIVGTPRLEAGVEIADYAWAKEGRTAGRLLLTARDGAIVRLVITFA